MNESEIMIVFIWSLLMIWSIITIVVLKCAENEKSDGFLCYIILIVLAIMICMIMLLVSVMSRFG